MSVITTVLSGGITGREVLEVSGYERIVYPELVIPYEPSKLYRIRARVSNTVRPTDSARNKILVGVEGLAADGETLVDANGSDSIENQFFVAAEYVDMQSKTLSTWYEFTGYLKGQGTYVPNATNPGMASPAHASVAFIAPVAWVNCTDGDGTCQIDSVFLDVLPENADQVAESSTKKWAAESGATVGAVVGESLKDGGGIVVEAEGILNANQQWADISGSGYTGTQAVNALNSDPSGLANLTAAGRTGLLTISETPGFGTVMALYPVDGLMYKADAYDSSAAGFMALALGTATGKQQMALPGAMDRNDAWSWKPGRNVYLSWSTRGGMTQTEPPNGEIRFVVGKALASSILYFNPQTMVTAEQGTIVGQYIYDFGSDLFNCLYEWNGALYAGCNYGAIYRSTDYGLTFTKVCNLGTGYSFNAFCLFSGTLYACTDHSPGFAIYRSSNGTTWSQSYLDTTEPYAYDLMAEVAGTPLWSVPGMSTALGRSFLRPMA